MKQSVLVNLFIFVAFGLASVNDCTAQATTLALGTRAPRPGGGGGSGDLGGSAHMPAAESPGPDAKRRFAVDQVWRQPQVVKPIAELNVGLAEMHLQWVQIEPSAPVNGKPNYRGVDDLPPQERKFLSDFAATGVDLSLVIESSFGHWAFEYSDSIMVESPMSGKQVSGFVKLNPAHRQDWKNFIAYLLSTFPNVRYIQMGNEPENVWVSGEGYVEALRLAYDAVREYNARHGSDVKLMAAGFNLGLDTLKAPESILRHVHEKHPRIDIEWVRRELNLPENITPQLVFHASQKFHVILSVLLGDAPPFDILTIHHYKGRSYDETERGIRWYQGVMEKGGYQRPLWIDDMHSAYFPIAGVRGTPEDRRIYKALKEGDAAAIQRYNKAQPEWLVKKAAWSFAAGVARLKFAPLVDIPRYFMPEWRYAGLLTEKFDLKPSYYTAKLLVQKIDYFKDVKRLRGDVYRFSFDHKDDVYIAWGAKVGGEIDASRELGTGEVRITYLISQLDRRGAPVVRPSIQVPTTRIPLTEEPVFIEKVRVNR